MAKSGGNPQNMQKFQQYLGKNQAKLPKSPEFLQYYSLPYIPNILEHEAFKHLFTKEWVLGLRQKLIKFLDQLQVVNSKSQLERIFVKSKSGNDKILNSQITQLKLKLRQKESQIQFQNQFVKEKTKISEKWRNFTKDLLNLTEEYDQLCTENGQNEDKNFDF